MRWPNGKISEHVVFQCAFLGQEAEVCYCESKMGKWGKWAMVIKESKWVSLNCTYVGPPGKGYNLFFYVSTCYRRI